MAADDADELGPFQNVTVIRSTAPALLCAIGDKMASTDRAWPFSFEDLCEALGLDAGCLRQELQKEPGA